MIASPAWTQGYENEETGMFTDLMYTDTILVPDSHPDIAQIVSSMAEASVTSTRVIDTLRGISGSGQRLTGKKAVLEIRMRLKLLYWAANTDQSLHMLEKEKFHIAYVGIPLRMEGTDPEYLLRNNYLKTEIHIEETNIRQTGSREIHVQQSVLAELHLVPTFELCCSLHLDCKSSALHLIHASGRHSTPITSPYMQKSLKPQWSPLGTQIAYLSNLSSPFMLYVHSLRTGKARQLTRPEAFDSVSGFSWTADGSGLVLSARKGDDKDLFLVDTGSLQTRRLTDGKGLLKSYKPKCSPVSQEVAFLRSAAGNADIWLLSLQGTECRKLTSYGDVRSFDWSPDGRQLAIIRSRGSEPDELHLVDAGNSNARILPSGDKAVKMRNVQFSPDGSSICVIGATQITEDLFIHDIRREGTANLTNHDSNIKISDFVWKIDATRIYFTTNELFYYNLYSLSMETRIRSQLTATSACDIELSYRPCIG